MVALKGKASLAACLLILAAADLPALADSLFWSEEYYDNTGVGYTSLRRMELPTGQVSVLLAGSAGSVGPTPHRFLPTAIAVDRVHEHLYYTDVNSDKIARMDFDGSGHVDVLTGFADPRAIELDVAAGKMYWANQGTDKILRANLDGTNVEAIVPFGTSGVYGLALDIPDGRIYWNDASRDVIASARLDGSDVRTFPSPGGGIGDIVVNPVLHKLIWSDAYSQKIYQSNVDGTVLEVLVASEGFPRSLAIDATARRLYWTDWNADKIFRADLLGRDVVEVYASPGISSGSGLAFLPEPSSVLVLGLGALLLTRRRPKVKMLP